jgi:hypothetical protein
MLRLLGNVTYETESATDKMTQRIEDSNKAIKELVSSASTLSKAFKEQAENGRLSEKTILDIVDAGYAACLQIDKETGAVRLDVEAYRQLEKAKIDEQIASLKLDRAALQKQIDEETEKIKGLAIATTYSARATSLLNEAQANKTGYEEMMANIDAETAALEEYAAAIDKIIKGTYNPSGSGSGGSKTNFSDIWSKMYGEADYLWKKGEMTAQAYWDGWRETNEKLSKQYGDAYKQEYQSRDLTWQKSGYDAEKQALEESLKYKLIKSEEYWNELNKLTEKYYSNSLQYDNMMKENISSYVDAFKSELEDRIKVVDFL